MKSLDEAIEAEIQKRLDAEEAANKPSTTTPSREEWQSINPGADYDEAMKLRQQSDAFVESNPYADLRDEAAKRASQTKQQTANEDLLKAAGIGAATGVLTSGSPLNPFKASPSTVMSSPATGIAEAFFGAQPGSVSQVMGGMRPTPVQTVSDIARSVASSNIPQVAPANVPTPPPLIDPKLSSGAAWLKNWANMPTEGFEGGVPEAAGKYESGKWHGKISSKISKRFPHGLSGQKAPVDEEEILHKVRQELHAKEVAKKEAQRVAQETAAREAEIARQAQATSKAVRLASPLSVGLRALGGAGIASSLYDAYQHGVNKDYMGSALDLGALGVGLRYPPAAPLAAAAVQLRNDPEARKQFLESMQPGGAYQQRMERRFGLD
jgi:hypothetical protein